MFKKLGAWFTQLWVKIGVVADKIDDKVEMYTPVAIKVCEGLETAVNSPITEFGMDLVTGIIPGKVDDKAWDLSSAFLQKNLPDIILKLKICESVSKITDKNLQMQAILQQFALLDVDTRTKAYIELVEILVAALADKKLTVSEIAKITAYVKANFIKK